MHHECHVCVSVWTRHTNLTAWRKVLVLVTWVSFLAVKEKEVDHLFLIVTKERVKAKSKVHAGVTVDMTTRCVFKQRKLCDCRINDPYAKKVARRLLTHSSDSRSLVSLSLSLKQPRECILSKTSGSISSAVASILMATFLGTGCSGSGSFFPALQHNTYSATHSLQPQTAFGVGH